MDGVKIEGTLTTQEAHDLLAITQAAYPQNHMLEVLQTRHNYPVMNRWFKNKIIEQSGKQIEEEVVIDPQGNAGFSLPYAGRTGSVQQSMASVRAPWRYAWSRYDISRHEMNMNRTPARLIELVKVRRAQAELAMAEQMEVAGFACPLLDSAGTDAHPKPYGLLYYLVPITGAQVTTHAAAVTAGTESAVDTGQHQGMNPIDASAGAYTDCMGINTTLAKYALWRSYNDVWSNSDCVIAEDDVDKMIRMKMKLQFEVPLNATDWASDQFNNYRGYVSMRRLMAMNRKGRENNDSLGADLGRYAGQVVVTGTTVQWNEELDSITSDPLLMVNHEKFYPVVMAGELFREDLFMPEKGQPDVHTTDTNCVFNFFCKNRRTAGGRIDWVAAS